MSPPFYFTQLSVSYLAQVILATTFAMYITWRKERATPTRLLAVAMWGGAGYFGGRFFYKSLPLHSIWQSYAQLVQYLSIILFIVFIIRFAYHLPRFLPRMGREYRIVKVVLGISTVVVVAAAVQLTMFRTSGLNTNYIFAYIGLGYAWTLFVLLRRTVLFEENGRLWFKKLLDPQTQAAQSNRTYAPAIFMGIAGTFVTPLANAGVLERPTANLIQTVFSLFGIFLFALSYLNHATERTNINAKLVGIPLFFVLLVLGVLPFWGTHFYERDYEPEAFAVIGYTTQFSPDAGGYTAVSIPTQYHIPSGKEIAIQNDDGCYPVELSQFTSFPFYGKKYDNICISDNGFVVLGEDVTSYAAIQYGQLPIIAALIMDMQPNKGGSIWLEDDADHLTVTWDGIPNSAPASTPNIIQLTLYPDGQIDITHEQISSEQIYGSDMIEGAWLIGLQSGRNRHRPQFVALPFAQGQKFAEGDSILHSYQMTFRSYLHERMEPLIWLVIIATALALLGIPIFIKKGLTRPLNTLIVGMERVDDGDLNVTVPIRYSDEIGRMTHSFNGMVDSIKQADLLKDEFLANTSHELRTPLNGIIGLTESMLAGATGPITPVQAQNLDLIALSGRRLANLVNDLLDFSKLKYEKLELHQRPTDVRAIVDLVLTISMPLAQDKGLTLLNHVPDELPFARADEDRLQQILHNLIGNAVKFTEVGEIEVSARPLTDFVEIWVRDTGIGIDREQQDIIFKPFEQVNSSVARTYGGTGLGLSITKKIVEMHGGQLHVESQVGTGTTFRFTLPRCTEEEMAMEKSTRSSTGLTSRPLSIVQNSIERKYKYNTLTPAFAAANQAITILVVDDEPINLQVLVNYLEPRGYHVVTAASGQETLQKIEDGLIPDLVILDVMMPHMTGYEVCEKIRLQYPVQKMPIIMLTARNQVIDLMRGFEAGANDYLTKPFSQEELLTRIRSHMQLARTNRAYGRFVPDEILEFLNRESIIEVQLGDQIEREMTIMFADVRGFTAMSENMTTKENFAFINALLGRIGPLIRQRGGFIDKYIGDSIMALFPEKADDAVEVAIAIQNELIAFNIDRAKTGYPLTKMGIGIHTGVIMLGTIGEEERMEGTVIADAVNTSSRIEALTKHYDVGILISEETLSGLSDVYKYQHRFMDRVKVKGKQGAVSVYEIFEVDKLRRKKAAAQAVFEHGARSYHDRDFETTVSCMKQVQAILPEDAVTASYLKRAKELLKDGVPDDWDGLARVSGI